MEEIQLSETEQRYFGDLFVCCDSDNTGKIPIYKASELFRSANLPLDVLKQVIRTQHERTSQSVMGFYKKQILTIRSSLYISVDTTVSPVLLYRYGFRNGRTIHRRACVSNIVDYITTVRKPAHKRFFHVVGYDMRFSASHWDDRCVFSRPVRHILFCIADVFRIKHPVNSSIRHF